MRADRLLLDTHAYLWWRLDSPRLHAEARDAIVAAPAVFVSVVSAWEAAIKVSLGKLQLNETVREGVEDSGFEPLAVTLAHTEVVVAQSLGDGLTLVTHDRRLAAYSVDIVWT